MKNKMTKKVYQKPEVEVVSVEQERYLMIGFTFENYAKLNDFAESENSADTNDGLHNTLANNGNVWNDEEE